jgi:uncharacterized membrane protein
MLKMARNVGSIFRRYFIDAMSYMAMGLFSSLIIGLIMSQLAKISALSFLAPFAEIISASSPDEAASAEKPALRITL